MNILNSNEIQQVSGGDNDNVVLFFTTTLPLHSAGTFSDYLATNASSPYSLDNVNLAFQTTHLDYSNLPFNVNVVYLAEF